jgi:ketosteroid isomerase-like protein
MLRLVRRPLAALAVAAAALAGCGDGPSDEQQVRTAVQAFSDATAAKDYQRLCDRLLAPALIEKIKQAGLPCEVALKQGLGDVKEPKLTIGRIAVEGDSATADIRTSATGQAPSRDTLKLTKLGSTWRIASLG